MLSKSKKKKDYEKDSWKVSKSFWTWTIKIGRINKNLFKNAEICFAMKDSFERCCIFYVFYFG